MKRTKIEGDVVRKRVSPGSKSDRVAVVLVAGDREFVLRQQGSDSFTGQDALIPLVGKKIRAVGSVDGSHFFMEEHQILDPKAE